MGPGALSLTSSHVMLLVPDAHGKRIPLARTPKLSYRICDCFPGVVGSLPCLTLQSLSVVGREPALQKNSPPRTLPRQEVPLKETILTPGGVPVTILALNGMKRPASPRAGAARVPLATFTDGRRCPGGPGPQGAVEGAPEGSHRRHEPSSRTGCLLAP